MRDLLPRSLRAPTALTTEALTRRVELAALMVFAKDRPEL